jgi:putative alpha-1,2-mannosidase
MRIFSCWLIPAALSHALADPFEGKGPLDAAGPDAFGTFAATSSGWGQMGAYVVLAGIGLFDMEGGCAAVPRYQISGPAFREVTLHQPGGDFHIRAISNSSKAIYIRSARLNGIPLEHLSLSHQDIAKGGTLVLQMSTQPTSQIDGPPAKPEP